MNKFSIKKHLSLYSILKKRRTTINHAFASAIAPTASFDEERLNQALIALGQQPDGALLCVYCDGLAKDWDHLVGLVKNSELRGFGHQLGNLVPCCQPCNSAKGSKDWKAFLAATVHDSVALDNKVATLEAYLEKFANEVDLVRLQELAPTAWAEYGLIKTEIFRLMSRADEVAKELRAALSSTQPN